MDFLKQFLPLLFEMIIIPAIGVLTVFIVSFIKKKKDELNARIDNELIRKYVDLLAETVCQAVVTTNQTYVNALKKQGKFDADAQREAFNMTYDAVMSMLSEEAIKYLTVFYGDFQTALRNLIESNVAEAANRYYEYGPTVEPQEEDIEVTELDKEQIMEALEKYKAALEK